MAKLMCWVCTEGAYVYDLLVLFVHCCIGLCWIAVRRLLQVNKSHSCMYDLIYFKVQPVHSALFVNQAEHYLLMSSSCFINPNVKTPLWDPTLQSLFAVKHPKESEKLYIHAPVKKHMYQFNCSLSHPQTLQNSWGTSQSNDVCVSFGRHPPLGPFIPYQSLCDLERWAYFSQASASKLGGGKDTRAHQSRRERHRLEQIKAI